jgi:maleate isomerase
MSEAIRLGVIVPSVNIVVEEWYPQIVPDGVSVRAIRQLASCRPHAIAHGCTASSIIQGHAFDERLRGR